MADFRPVLIVVRDGWGVREEEKGNATAIAKTLDRITEGASNGVSIEIRPAPRVVGEG